MRNIQNIPPVPNSGYAYVTLHNAKSVEPKVDLFLDSDGSNSTKEPSFSSIELALLSENKILLNILNAGKFNCVFNYHTKTDCDLLFNRYIDNRTKKPMRISACKYMQVKMNFNTP
jgi:hypothetical protein